MLKEDTEHRYNLLSRDHTGYGDLSGHWEKQLFPAYSTPPPPTPETWSVTTTLAACTPEGDMGGRCVCAEARSY